MASAPPHASSAPDVHADPHAAADTEPTAAERREGEGSPQANIPDDAAGQVPLGRAGGRHSVFGKMKALIKQPRGSPRGTPDAEGSPHRASFDDRAGSHGGSSTSRSDAGASPVLDGQRGAGAGGAGAVGVLGKVKGFVTGTPTSDAAAGGGDAAWVGRPANLPPKSAKEASLHAKQIERLEAAAKRKAVQEKRQEEALNKSILLWEGTILCNWEQKRAEKRTQRMWREGIPDKVRAALWHKAIGNSLSITPDLYHCFKVRAADIRMQMKREGSPVPSEASPQAGAKQVSASDELRERDHTAIQSIDVDMPRTFPSFQEFKEGPLATALLDILQAYVQYRPDVGYVQGMSYIVAMLLLHMDTDHVFPALVNLLHSSHLLTFFRVDVQDIGMYLRLYDLLLEDTVPAIHAHLKAIHLTPQLYVYDWFMTIFSKSLPVTIACRIWDLFLLHPMYLHIAAIGVLLYFQNDICAGTFDTCFRLLTHLPKDIHDTDLLNLILSVKIDPKRYELLKQRATLMDNTCYVGEA